MSKALNRVKSYLLLVRQVAYSVRVIRGARIQANVVQACLQEAETNGEWETVFRLGKSFDPRFGIIYFQNLLAHQRSQDRQLFRVEMPADLAQEALGHSHPFGKPAENTHPSIIDYPQIHAHQEGVSNSAIVIFGGGQSKGWGIGAWTYDELKINDPYPDDHREAEQNIYSLPLKVVRGTPGTFELHLDEAGLGEIGLVGIDNRRPYPATSTDDVNDVISLRKWLIAAEFLCKGTGPSTEGFRLLEIRDRWGREIKPETPDNLLKELKEIVTTSSRPEFTILRSEVNRRSWFRLF